MGRIGRWGRVRLLTVVGVLAGVVAVVPQVRADPPENAFTWHEVWFPSADGTQLHADVLLPAGHVAGQQHPVILNIGPYSARSGPGPAARYPQFRQQGRIFERGYAWVQVDSRGYGASGGCNDFGGRGEQSDVKAAVEWAATQPWSTGKVGMYGGSYDAWTQVMALAQRPRGLAATIVASPLLEAYRGLWMHGVHYNQGWYTTPALYARYDLTPSAGLDGDRSGQQFLHPTLGTAQNPDCYRRNLTETLEADRSHPYWRERDIVEAAATSEIPVLWTHGFNDINTKPDNILDVFSRLRGPRRAWFGQFNHVEARDAVAVGRDGFVDEAMSWFDHHLKGLPAADLPAVEIQDGSGRWRSEASWPPADAAGRTLPILAGSYVDDGIGDAVGSPGTWTFTPPAPHDLRLSGEAHAVLDLVSPADKTSVFVKLWDVSPTGWSTLITRGAHAFDGESVVDVELFPQDWLLPAGHRLGIEVTGQDSLWQPVPTRAAVQVRGGTLTAPFLQYLRTYDLTGERAFAQVSVPRRQLAATLIADRTASAVTFPPAMTPAP